MMTKDGSTKIVFKMDYSQAKIRQTNYKVLITEEGSTKIVNFMTPRPGVLMLGVATFKSL